MTTPPAIPSAAGQTAAKSRPKGKPAGQVAPRERNNRFHDVLAQANTPKHGAPAGPPTAAQPASVRRPEQLLRDGGVPPRALRGLEREGRGSHFPELMFGETDEPTDFLEEVRERNPDLVSAVTQVATVPCGVRFAPLLQVEAPHPAAADSFPAQPVDREPQLKKAAAGLMADAKVEIRAAAAPAPPLAAQGVVVGKDVRAEPKPSAERPADPSRLRHEADITPAEAMAVSGLAAGGKPERSDRSSSGAADPRASPPPQALAAVAPVNLFGPFLESRAAEGPAQQILRQLSEAEPMFRTGPETRDVQAAPRSMRLKLSPGNLGEVEIRIARAEGQLSIRIRAERRETAEMLKNDSSLLLERLEFSAGADTRIEIEFAGVPDAGQHQDAMDGSGSDSQGGANRQATEREALPKDRSAPRKPAGPSQDHDDPDHGRQMPRGRPDVLLL